MGSDHAFYRGGRAGHCGARIELPILSSLKKKQHRRSFDFFRSKHVAVLRLIVKTVGVLLSSNWAELITKICAALGNITSRQ